MPVWFGWLGWLALFAWATLLALPVPRVLLVLLALLAALAPVPPLDDLTKSPSGWVASQSVNDFETGRAYFNKPEIFLRLGHGARDSDGDPLGTSMLEAWNCCA